MLDRDFLTIFNYSDSLEHAYNYTEKYTDSTDVVVSYGSVKLGDAYPLNVYNGTFIAINNQISQSTPFRKLPCPHTTGYDEMRLQI